MNRKLFYSVVVLFSLTIVFFNSCEMYEYHDPISDAETGAKIKTTIAGSILDESNLPVSGATVNVSGITTSTDQHGNFYFDNIDVPEKRCVIKVTKGGYLNGYLGVIPHKENVTYMRMILLESDPANSISSATGGMVNLLNGASVVLPANAYVYASNGNAYSGTVNVSTKFLSPGDADFSFKTPGGDLLGKNLADEEVALISYGMLSVELKDNSGQKLQLAPNSNATLKIPIAASQISSSPNTIPLWHFDEATAIWKEEGTATKNGNFYEGTVHHFSWYNLDHPCAQAFIEGKVVDCSGNPMPNIVVTVDVFYSVMTNNNGFYHRMVPANYVPMPVQVLASNNPGLQYNSSIFTVPILSTQQTYTLPDITITCPTRVAGTITECGHPSAHAFIRAGWPGGYNFIYTTDGNYTLSVEASSNISLEMRCYNGNSWKFITSGVQNSVTTIGNTDLCNPNINNLPFENSFVIDGNQHYYELVDIDTAGYYCGAVQSGAVYYVYINGVNYINNSPVAISILLPDTIPGNYPMNAGMTCDNTYYSLSGQFPNYKVKLQKWSQEPGGIVSGTFESVDSSNGVHIYMGNFSVHKAY